MNNLLDIYKTFVDGVTSETSKDTDLLIIRIKELQKQGIDVARILTCVIGSSGESGELADLWKKCLFHGKPVTDEVILQTKKELGDQLWYWMQGCIALNVNPSEIIEMNIDKLKSRYPGGFSIERSEHRSEDDT